MMKSVITVEAWSGLGTAFAVVNCMPVLDGVEAADFTMDRNNSDTLLS